MSELAGRVAVVTGAADGIGFAVAAAAAARGMRVALVDIDGIALRAAAQRLVSAGAEAEAFTVDVGDFPSMTRLAQAIESRWGPVWLCCNNAGVSSPGWSWTLTVDDWDRILRVNVRGVINGIQVFLPGMVDRNAGHLVNVASVAGLLAPPGRANYVASKHAVVGLSETIYRELMAEGVDVGVTVACPGPVATRRWAGRPIDNPEVVTAPEDLAEEILTAVLRRQFWLLPHGSAYAAAMRARIDGALNGRNPDAASADPVVKGT